jgi:hypothetical protein
LEGKAKAPERDDKDKEAIFNELVDCFNPSEDGYAFARELERKGWMCDFEFAEILNGFEPWYTLEKAWVGWVRDNDAHPKFKEGDLVKFSKYRHHKDHIIQGFIRNILSNGQYKISTNEGKEGNGYKTIGYLIPWEDVEALN